MSRAIAVLRPEPGNRVTTAAIEARGRRAIRLPLFEARAVAWEVPDPERFDALLLTSANAVRHAGAGLTQLRELPVHAVGDVTAEAARRAGFAVASIGESGAEALVARAEAMGVQRALHLAGRERTLEIGGIIAEVVTIYVSEALPITADMAARLAGSVALIQSARAGARLAEIVALAQRKDIILVATSERAAAAAGAGWERVLVPPEFRGTALIDAAIALAD
ncbi:uroporphyrinogen-III synthase [Sphingomonas sp. JC676]|uniref:uroporphyrinogen-III synthase n=1 Tax=Sphingomonas sp. JC676 TaxID=2768065 RepID=UPI001657687B|nr:uroporphyrinogen-III synthase [Sphingomonas sp. JC676]MBC9034632.1 uroporphyrinogen-III synthase [Sphingomonas sp. JC676]